MFCNTHELGLQKNIKFFSAGLLLDRQASDKILFKSKKTEIK